MIQARLQLCLICPTVVAMQIIDSLLNSRMAGEGNLLRHLAQLTYKLHYVQDPLSDFDFTLNNPSAELRDGLRLCKLAEVLTGLADVDMAI